MLLLRLITNGFLIAGATLLHCGYVQADNLFLSNQGKKLEGQTGYGGKLISIQNNVITFDMKCAGDMRTYNISNFDGIQISKQCVNKRVDNVGGDEDGCSWDQPGTPKGLKSYIQVLRSPKGVYAFKNISYNDGVLKGKLLITGREVTIKRDEIKTISPQSDCNLEGVTEK